MIRILLISIAILIFCSTKSQTTLFGEYKLSSTNDEKLDFKSVLKLNCDNTFTIIDSSFIGTGTWIIRNGRNITLKFTSTNEKKADTPSTKILDLLLFENYFAFKPMSKRAYKSLYKKINKSAGEVAISETYTEYKIRERKHVYLKTKAFMCN